MDPGDGARQGDGLPPLGSTKPGSCLEILYLSVFERTAAGLGDSYPVGGSYCGSGRSCRAGRYFFFALSIRARIFSISSIVAFISAMVASKGFEVVMSTPAFLRSSIG